MLDIWARLAADKKQHIIGSCIACFGLFLIWMLAQRSLPAAVAAAGVAFGVGFEYYQKIRHEGEPSWGDAAASASAFLLLAVVLAVRG